MPTAELENLKFPTGKYEMPSTISKEHMEKWMETVSNFPMELEHSLANVDSKQLDWKYRPKGWTIKQVVHHCADSHMNAFIRFKLALTEDMPTIKPYLESKWAETDDVLLMNVEESVFLLKHLHKRWVKLLESLSEEDLQRCYIHPQQGKSFSLKGALGLYAWHCTHHLAHIENALRSEGKWH